MNSSSGTSSGLRPRKGVPSPPSRAGCPRSGAKLPRLSIRGRGALAPERDSRAFPIEGGAPSLRSGIPAPFQSRAGRPRSGVFLGARAPRPRWNPPGSVSRARCPRSGVFLGARAPRPRTGSGSLPWSEGAPPSNWLRVFSLERGRPVSGHSRPLLTRGAYWGGGSRLRSRSDRSGWSANSVFQTRGVSSTARFAGCRPTRCSTSTR